MVTSNLAFKEKNSIEPEVVVNESPVKWCTVALSDVVARGKRLEASVFDVEAEERRGTAVPRACHSRGSDGMEASNAGAGKLLRRPVQLCGNLMEVPRQ